MAQFVDADVWKDDSAWRLIFDQAPLAACLIEARTGSLARVNPALAEMMGRGVLDLQGSHWSDLIHPDDREPFEQAVADASEGTRSLDTVRMIDEAAVGYTTVTIESIPEHEERGPRVVARLVDVTNVVSDRTDLVRAREAARASDRSREAFLAGMSHELRTPLNAVIGLSSILTRGTFGELEEKQLEMIEQIETSGRQLLQLIDDVLDFAKMRSLSTEIQPVPVPLRQMIHEAANQVREQADRNGVEFEVREVPSDEIVCDPGRMRQLVVQLLSNAIKFTNSGGTAWIEGAIEDGAVSITVGDTGIGIRPEAMKDLFAPFKQGDSNLDREAGGAGLGLALAKEIVDLHGGEISVESEPGYGSLFVVSLRQSGPVDMPETTKKSAADVNINPATRLLVVDDNAVNRTMMSDYLAELGLEVDVAGDGSEAITKARDSHPDLILMDVQMPGMDGLEATRILKASAETADIPVVALTALAISGDAERCLEAGCGSYVTKPVDFDELITTIDEQLAA